MTYSFNLIDKPWIPCLTPDGERVELGLRDTLGQAHMLREIRGGSPLETASLYRLLLAVLHRVFGPDSARAWKSLWERRQFDRDMLEDYLLQPNIYQRFDLFEPSRPFYQSFCPRDDKTSMISLLLHTASGNNATLFDHSTQAVGLTLTPAQTARALITSHLFGLGGLSGLPQNFTDAPGAKGTLFFAHSRNLFETLTLNMVQYGEDRPFPTPDGDDLPAWEMDDPFSPDRSQPKGYLDYLTWHNRRIWLYPEEIDGHILVREMHWAPGLRLDTADTDPMKHFFVDKKGGARPLCFTPNRALWRDSNVLFELGSVDKPPGVVRWLARLAQPPISALDTDRRYQLIAVGLAKNQARLDFLRSERLPLPVGFLKHPDLVGTLGRALQAAESCASAIHEASFVLAWLVLSPNTEAEVFKEPARIRAKIKSGSQKQSKDEEATRIYKLAESWWGVERYYWSDLEVYFHRLIQDLPDAPEQALLIWRDHVRRAATAAFNQAERYADGDHRAMRAVAIARQRFKIGLTDTIGKANEPNLAEGGDEA